jgi:HlyD family secretion protein
MAFKLSNFPYKYLVLLLLLGLVVWAMPWLIHGPQVTVVEVRRADLVQSLVASGRVESPHRVEVGVQMTAQVASVLVSEGDQVLADFGVLGQLAVSFT